MSVFRALLISTSRFRNPDFRNLQDFGSLSKLISTLIFTCHLGQSLLQLFIDLSRPVLITFRVIQAVDLPRIVAQGQQHLTVVRREFVCADQPAFGIVGAVKIERGATAFDESPFGMDLDLSVTMTVSLEESVKGGEKRVRLPTGKELNVKIPAGVVAGQQIRLKGQGETAPGHPPGDLLITISIAPHPFFKIDGSDLRVDLPVTLYEAVLGAKVRAPTLGGAVDLSIPKNTSSGRTFRLKGKGLPKAGGGSGDLYFTTRIMLPDGNDADLEALMQKWRADHPYNPRSDLT
jgi:curved DNA-binding protein CbpA